MALGTYSKFYYIDPVTSLNQWIDFDEGSGEVSAQVSVGKYTLSGLASAIAIAMNDAGANTYTATVDRSTREITIAATSGSFSVLIATGTHKDSGIYDLINFGVADLSSASSHTGGACGSEYAPQFLLQSYTGAEHWQTAVSGVVNESASGAIETVSFGRRQFIEFEIVYSNNYSRGNFEVIKNDPSAVENLVDFLGFAINKYPFEFMPDEGTVNTFYEVILESTESDGNGLGFRLTEMVDKNLAGFYKTGKIKLRVV